MSEFATSRLTISQEALQANYALVKSKVGLTCDVAAAVKADAYGIGIDAAVPAFEKMGCSFFYVANLDEALQLRAFTRKQIAVLSGMEDGMEDMFRHHHFIPVLNRADIVSKCPDDIQAIWHIDTGMNRLGIPVDLIPELLQNAPAPLYLMSHFSSSDEEELASSLDQVALFDSVAPSSLPHSLCNSSALFRDTSWHRQQVRPGMCLYGLNPTPWQPNPMQPVIELSARILQVTRARSGSTVGYNRTYRCENEMDIAIIGIGYADGFHRAGSNKSRVYFNGVACPVIGRVSMDLISVDLTPVKDKMPREGEWMEIIGPHQTADELADSWGTIGYEVLTSLAGRSERIII